jgi:hypothetical protein
MQMQTNLVGRLRNTSLPTTCGLLPLFEAVVNSIHSVEEAAIPLDKGVVRIEILRKPKQNILFEDPKKKKGPDAHEEITGFKISDNGIGFTNSNLESFKTLDTERKIAKGGRGIGRLLWLKAFKSVHVSSIFEEEGKCNRRLFHFTPASGVSNESKDVLVEKQPNETIVHLDDFEAKYRDNCRKTLKAIGESVLEHCLWYFVRKGGSPKITIFDDGEPLELDDLYDQTMHSSAVPDSLKINGILFELIHVKLRSNSLLTHGIAFCADNRLVTEEKIEGKIPGLYGRLSDEKGDFVYECYVSSTFLDEAKRPERTGFDISDSNEPLFLSTPLGLPQIRSAILEKASVHLSKYLEANLQNSRERVDKFVSQKAPRYRPIMGRIPEGSLYIDPSVSDKDLDLALHKQLFEIESQLLAEGHDIMKPAEAENATDYRKRLADYLSKAEDIKRSDLANYVSHRKVVLDLLGHAIQRTSNGSYAREDLIHNLIMPMRNTSSDVLLDSCNLWLVDERLAFHDFLASDKTLKSMPITGCDDTTEPDLCSLCVFDNPILVSEGTKLPLASIVVIEIKKPMRNDAAAGEDDDPIEQAIGYLNRIRKGEVTTSKGRPIPESLEIPGFCYVLALLRRFQWNQ